MHGLQAIDSLSVDTLVKASSSAVYYYAADNNRYVFPNAKTYNSWFTDFSGVVTISDEELAQIPLKGNVTYRPGIRMVKIQTNPKVYAVEQGGKLRWIETEALAEELYGQDWYQKIDDVPDAFFVNYQEGEPVATSADYLADDIASQTKTINKDKGIQATQDTPVSDTVVGGLATPTTPAQPDAISILPVISNIQAENITASSATLTWQTDKLADSKVSYALSSPITSDNAIDITDSSMVETHSIELSDLASNTTYYYLVVSTDADGHTAISNEQSFATLINPLPVITNIQASDITPTSATISWTTDEPADSKVSYTATTTVESLNSALTTSHSLSIVGLTAETIYDYYVVSTDADGGTAISAEQSFTTLALPTLSATWSNVRVTNITGNKGNPALVWSGSGYGIVWHDYRKGGGPEVYFAKADQAGKKTVNDVMLSSNNINKISYSPAIAWTGSQYGVVWSEYSRLDSENANGCYLYFARLNADGVKQGENISITSDNYGTCPSQPSIVWTGSEYGIAWHENRQGAENSRVYFTHLNAQGEKQGADVQVTDMANSEESSIAWSGSEYGIVWQAGEPNPEIYFARLNADGVKQGDDIKVSNTGDSSLYADLVWHGSGYAIVWQDYDASGIRQIYFTKLDPNGIKQVSDITVTSNSGLDYSVVPSLAWTGFEYGVVWQQTGSFIYFVRLDANGTKKSVESKISDNRVGVAERSIIAWNGSKYGAVWQDNRNIWRMEIYFATGPSGIVLGTYDIDSNPLDLQFGWLIKNIKHKEVFFVDSSFCLHWITNEQAAEKYFGSSWHEQIKEFAEIPQVYEYGENMEV